VRSIIVILVLGTATAASADDSKPVPAPKPDPVSAAPLEPRPPVKLGSKIIIEPPIDRWYRGKYGDNRVIHVTITATGAVMYLTSEVFLKSQLSAHECHWCNPGSFDNSARNALLWSNPKSAQLASNITGYVIVPLFVASMSLYALSTTNPRTSRVIDDVTPIAETVVLSQLVTQAMKFTVGRERPFVHFGPPGMHSDDDDASFFSGHSALVFGVVTSAGMIAHRHHYKTEPYIWGIGLPLAVATGYLRIAGDKHYLTDVLVGAGVGIGAGLTVPLLMQRPEEHAQQRTVSLVPTGNGAMLVGTF
jgi:membrane-associated phospholipid phosphatase